MTKIYKSFRDYCDTCHGVLVASSVWHARDAEVDALKNRVKELSDAWCNEQRRADEALDKYSNLLDERNKCSNEDSEELTEALDSRWKMECKASDLEKELELLRANYSDLTKLYNEVRESEKCLLRIIREKM
jgi:prefoldin subunit 5